MASKSASVSITVTGSVDGSVSGAECWGIEAGDATRSASVARGGRRRVSRAL